MKRKASLWLVFCVLITLIGSTALPPSGNHVRASSPGSQQVRAASKQHVPDFEPTSYDRLHHGSPSTHWTAFAARGVNMVFGNFVAQFEDLSVEGRGIGVSFVRTYNSADQETGPLGKGWTHSYNAAVIDETGNTVTLRNPDGRLDQYIRQADGSYVAPPGVFSVLTRLADGSSELTLKNQVVYHFDQSGRLAYLRDRNDNTILLNYADGNLASLIDTAGRSYAFNHDQNHRLVAITDPMGREIAFTYDSNGLLTSSADPSSMTTSYTYDTNQRLTALIDANNHAQARNTYDAGGRVILQHDADNNTTTFEYQPSTGQTTVTDPRSASTTYTYDAGFRVTAIHDAYGMGITYAYDSQNNRTRITDRRANATNLTYDSRGNITQVIDAAGGIQRFSYDAQNNLVTARDALQSQTTLTYDTRGNPLTVVDAMGYTTAFTYDALGQVTSIVDANGNITEPEYDANGNPIAVTDALNHATHFVYDSIGRMTGMTDAGNGVYALAYDPSSRPTQITDAAGGVTHFAYDNVGNRLSVTNANGHTTQFAYDAKNQLITVIDAASGVTHYGYDANGNRTTMQDPSNQVTASEYDLLNRLVSVTNPLGQTIEYSYDAVGNRIVMTDTMGMATTFVYDALNRLTSTTDPLGHTTTMAYDAIGNLVRQTDALGRDTVYSYDALSRLRSVTDPAGNTVRYYYDGVGNRTAVVDAKGAATLHVYDQVNRLVMTEDALGHRTLYEYDPLGNLASKVDANGQQTTYQYDALSRLQKAIYPDNSISYDYDAVGNRTHVIDIQGVTRYDYDALNRIIRVTNPANQSVGYTYDLLGRRTSLIYPDSRAVTYAYDAASRLVGVTDWDNQTTHYTYNDRSQVSTIGYPNGATVSYSYDTAGRLTEILHRDAAGQVFLPISYTLDANGNRTSMTDDRGVEQYSYDALDRLTQVVYADGEMVSYTYDPAGNRLSLQSSLLGATTYTYDDGDRLLQMVNPDGSITEFDWDANGNMIRTGDVQYLFDSANRLTQVIDGENVVLFTYDGDGHRLMKVVNGTKSQYAIDLGNDLPHVLTETSDGNTVYYTYGIALNGLVEPSNEWHFYHADGIGSVRRLSGVNGHPIAGYDYLVFGELSGQNGDSVNEFLYTGEQMDIPANHIFLRARYYLPTLGRFISPDLWPDLPGQSQSVNQYAYVSNNPTNLVDPRGLRATVPSIQLGNENLESCPNWSRCNPDDPSRIASPFMDFFTGTGLGAATSTVNTAFLGGSVFGGLVLDGSAGFAKPNRSKGEAVALLTGAIAGALPAHLLVAVLVPPALGVVTDWIDGKYDYRLDPIRIPDWTSDSALNESRWLCGRIPQGLDGCTQICGPSDTLCQEWTRRTQFNSRVLPPIVVETPTMGAVSSPVGSSVTGANAFLTSPSTGQFLKEAQLQIRALTTGHVVKVSFHAYYATNPTDISTVTWHNLGWAQRIGDTWVLDWDLATIPDQGNAGWGTVAVAAHYYTCDGPPGSACEHLGDQVRVDVDRGPLTWDFANNSLGWSLVNGSHQGFDSRAWKFEPGNDPQLVSPPMAVDATRYNAVEVVMDTTASNRAGRIYFTTQASPSYSEDKSVGYVLTPNGKYRAYLVYIGTNPHWQGIITGLRLDPVQNGDPDSSSDFVFVDKIAFRRIDGTSATTWAPDGSLVRGADETIYLIERGQGGVSLKRPFPSADVFLSCGYSWNKILYLSEAQLASYNDGAPMTVCSGAILKGSAPAVYFIENGTKRHFCSADVYLGMGYSWEAIRIVADSTLEAIPTGEPLCTGWTSRPDGSLVKTASSATTYLLENGAKRTFSDVSVFQSWGRRFGEIATISEAEMASYSLGSNVPVRDGALIKTAADQTVFVVEGGKCRPFKLATDFEAFGFRWENILTVPNSVRDQTPLGIRIAPDPLVLVTGLTVTPDWPATGQSTTAAFLVQNTGNKSVAVQALRAEVPTVGAFPVQTAAAMQPGQTTSYNQSRTFSATGTYQARAQVQLDGQWKTPPTNTGQSAEAGFTVMMIAAPTLNPISNPNQSGTYQVSWSAVSGATLYQLQEDDDPNFGSPQVVYQASGTSWSVTGHVAGNFHYRVRVLQPHTSGFSGPRSVTVQGTPVYVGWHPDGTLLKRPDHPEVMLLENGQRRPFPNASIYFSHYPTWDPIGIAQPVEYEQYPAGPDMRFRNGTIVKNPDNQAVYSIINNTKRHFCSADTYLGLGFSWEAIQVVPTAHLPSINGPILCLSSLRFEGSLIKSAGNDQVYWVKNGQKLQFPYGNVYLSHGYDWAQTVVISDDELAHWPTGSVPSLRNGTIIKCEEAGCNTNAYAYWIIDNGQRREFKTAAGPGGARHSDERKWL